MAETVVVKRARDIGTANAKPLLDSSRYLVRFKTGDESEFAANEIAEICIRCVISKANNIS